MGGVAVGADGGEADRALLVGDGVWCGDAVCSTGDGGIVDGVNVVDFKSNIYMSLVVAKARAYSNVPLTASPWRS